MLSRNIWGGPAEIIPAKHDDTNTVSDWDRSAYTPPSDEVKQGWLLRPDIDQINKSKKKTFFNAATVRMALFLAALAIIVTGSVLAAVFLRRRHTPPPPPKNYTVALHQALSFFDAQRSGKIPKSDVNKISWRGDSCLGDDNVGGYYDGGDSSKFNFPSSFSMTLLSWSVIEYSQKYQALGELAHVKNIIKWGTDYLLTTFNSSADSTATIPSQILSSAESDPNGCWIRPEDVTGKRTPERHDSYPALAAEMAAALASASIVFKSENAAYSDELVHGAATLFKFATKDHRDGGCNAGKDPPMEFYNSTGYWDEFLWAGAWLYYASGNQSYIDFATDKARGQCIPKSPGAFGWNDKLAGAELLLARARLFLNYGFPYEDMLSKYHDSIRSTVCSYLPSSRSFRRTNGGLIMLTRGKPRPLQYVANSAFLAVLFSDYLGASIQPGFDCGTEYLSKDELARFARGQMDYILGHNPAAMSYVVGFGDKYPVRVHHRGSSIPKMKGRIGCGEGVRWRDSKKANPNVIVGGMVGGPDGKDGFGDVRTNYNYTEPSLAGNAGLVAALVALSDEGVSGIDKNTMFYSVRPT